VLPQSLYVRRLIRHIMTSIHYQNLDYSVYSPLGSAANLEFIMNNEFRKEVFSVLMIYFEFQC
jgi:hypothetical protein